MQLGIRFILPFGHFPIVVDCLYGFYGLTPISLYFDKAGLSACGHETTFRILKEHLSKVLKLIFTKAIRKVIYHLHKSSKKSSTFLVLIFANKNKTYDLAGLLLVLLVFLYQF
jgi:hypothetical protein